MRMVSRSWQNCLEAPQNCRQGRGFCLFLILPWGRNFAKIFCLGAGNLPTLKNSLGVRQGGCWCLELTDALRHYIAYRDTILSDPPDEVIVTYGKPYHPVSKDTLARWIKDLLSLSGIDTSIFKPHSCHSASTSKASSSGVAIEHILKSGQWKSSSTFHQFYCRNITWTDFSENAEFANSTLEVLF